MEILPSSLPSLSPHEQAFFFIVALITTVFSLLIAFLTLRSLLRKSTTKSDVAEVSTSSAPDKEPSSFWSSSSSSRPLANCSVNGIADSAQKGGAEAAEVAAAKVANAAVAGDKLGVSMMEQLVPEITTQALSYLDYPSLCRLSMTNSLMRKAANDDNAWKALYHKDFTLEQDTVNPINGWKAYYAATRAIVNVNTEFFNIIRERSLQAMARFWLNTDYIKCIHASGELFSGYNAVMQSWQLYFNWEQGFDFQVHDVRARISTDMAWVTMKAYLNMDGGPFHVTNVFEFHNRQWHMVHHHSSMMMIDGVEQQVHGL